MAVREGLLALLATQSRYGYELKTEFEAATGGVWTLNVGQVYTTLDRLERDGLVTMTELDSPSGGPQKSYEITAAGREELGQWWHATPSDQPPPRDELMLKVLTAIDRGRTQALDVITRQRNALFSMLQQHRRASLDAGDLDLSTRLVTDALIVRAEADLRWLDQCETRVLQSSNDASPDSRPIPVSSSNPSSTSSSTSSTAADDLQKAES